MYKIPKDIEKELLAGAINWSFMKITGLMLEDIADIKDQLKDIDWWQTCVLDGQDGLYDVFFVATPVSETKATEDSIVLARRAFRGEHYEDAIEFAERYLKSKNRPDVQVYGMLGIAYYKYAGHLKDNVFKGRNPREEAEEILKNESTANDYLRLYNYFCGKTNTEEFDDEQIISEVDGWLDRQTPKEKISEKKVRLLDIPLLITFNNECVRSMINGGIRIKKLTVESVGKTLGYNNEEIDLAKIAYARLALRANMKHVACRYIESVERTSDRTNLVDAKLAQFREEVADMSLLEKGSKNNPHVKRLLYSQSTDKPRLVFIKPGTRQTND